MKQCRTYRVVIKTYKLINKKTCACVRACARACLRVCVCLCALRLKALATPLRAGYTLSHTQSTGATSRGVLRGQKWVGTPPPSHTPRDAPNDPCAPAGAPTPRHTLSDATSGGDTPRKPPMTPAGATKQGAPARPYSGWALGPQATPCLAPQPTPCALVSVPTPRHKLCPPVDLPTSLPTPLLPPPPLARPSACPPARPPGYARRNS